MSEGSSPKSPSRPTQKRLFALSGNRCAFPDCQTRLTDRTPTGSVVGEVCHIKGEKPTAPRFDKDQSDEARHGFGNLILLCNVHHKIVDDNAEEYSVDALTSMKERHEKKLDGKEAVDDAKAEQFVSARGLKVSIAPTHNGRQQLAQIRLFNSGPGAIFVGIWWAQWGIEGVKGGRASISTVKGKLPVRIEEQDVAELFVEIGDDLEELSGIGVIDGDGHLWLADEKMLEVFKHQAIAHRLPPLPAAERQQEQKSFADLKVEIETRANSTVKGPRQRLEVLFKNKSEQPIPIRSVRLSWTYSPPRKAPSPTGKSVAEAGGSVGLSPQSRTGQVNPGDEALFVLDDDFSVFLVELLRGDVRDEDIKIEVTAKGVAWVGTMDEIPEAVRSVAQSVLKSLHDARG